VPASALLGPEHGGWKVAMESLNHERDMIWIMNLVEIEEANALTRSALLERPQPELELEYAAVRCDADAIWLTGLRGLASRLAGRPDRETPLLKLFATETAQRAFLLARRAAGLDVPDRLGHELLVGEIEARSRRSGRRSTAAPPRSSATSSASGSSGCRADRRARIAKAALRRLPRQLRLNPTYDYIA
jgi:alkylation response protein AidB-like acyl-CoA dehydrogenase